MSIKEKRQSKINKIKTLKIKNLFKKNPIIKFKLENIKFKKNWVKLNKSLLILEIYFKFFITKLTNYKNF